MANKPILLDIQRYEQFLPGTCGPAALMMSMNFVDPRIPLTREMEMQIWSESAMLPFRMTTALGLAISALRRGFEVSVFKKSESFVMPRMDRDTFKHETLGGRISSSKLDMMYLIQKHIVAESPNARIVWKSITKGDILHSLENGLPTTAMVYDEMFAKGNEALHWLVIRGYDEGKGIFLINDPSPANYKSIPSARLLAALNVGDKMPDIQALVVLPRSTRGRERGIMIG